jgi:hypothetical protein
MKIISAPAISGSSKTNPWLEVGQWELSMNKGV